MNAAKPIPTFEEVMAGAAAELARTWYDEHPELLLGSQAVAS